MCHRRITTALSHPVESSTVRALMFIGPNHEEAHLPQPKGGVPEAVVSLGDRQEEVHLH